MDSSSVAVAHEFLPFLRVYKDGRIERLMGTEVVSASIDSHPSVSSKDVIINAETGLSARLYIPKNLNKGEKLPLLIYFHGGAFLIESAFSPLYHSYLNSIVAEANCVAVSVNYRLAPEYPLPVAYDDSWEAIQWVDAGDESWLREYADFDRVFMSGDSAGANIVHDMAMRAGGEKLRNGLKFVGVALVHPYFWGEEAIGSEVSDPEKKAQIDRIWYYVCPSTTGLDDPRINPVAKGAPSLGKLACRRALVFVAEKDALRNRGVVYYEGLKKSGWEGVVEIIEAEGEDHVFHLFNTTSDRTVAKLKCVASFINSPV